MKTLCIINCILKLKIELQWNWVREALCTCMHTYHTLLFADASSLKSIALRQKTAFSQFFTIKWHIWTIFSLTLFAFLKWFSHFLLKSEPPCIDKTASNNHCLFLDSSGLQGAEIWKDLVFLFHDWSHDWIRKAKKNVVVNFKKLENT